MTGSFYPLLCGVSDGKGAGEAAREALLAKVVAQGAQVEARYRENADYFAHFFDTRLTVTTPDKKFDEAMRWAELAIESAKVASPHGAGLAGGWFGSGDSARPGFGWFFGRDTLWSLYAVNSYGNFALSREAMDFLFAHQRVDGKVMHEVSQTANLVDWVHLPYLYAAADSTPLLVMQVEDYVRTSGDTEYLKAHWDAVRRAYGFTRAHTTEGVYDNTQGTGWVEEWQPRMPHQEIYLAALDAESSQSMERLAGLMGDSALRDEAAKTEGVIRARLAGYRGADGIYAFSRNADGTFENVASIFPTVAWWTGRMALPDADATFARWAGHTIATDWGVRSVATDQPFYDPISYHHGSVWPLYTGWAAMAAYRAGRALNGYANLRANADLTWVQDLGDVTELLSGEFYEPLGRSSSHQLWSSAMVVTPAVRGMFGLEADGLRHALHAAPQLPAGWDGAEVKNVMVGKDRFDVTMKRCGQGDGGGCGECGAGGAVCGGGFVLCGWRGVWGEGGGASSAGGGVAGGGGWAGGRGAGGRGADAGAEGAVGGGERAGDAVAGGGAGRVGEAALAQEEWGEAGSGGGSDDGGGSGSDWICGGAGVGDEGGGVAVVTACAAAVGRAEAWR